MLSDFHQLPSQYRNLSRWSPRNAVGTVTGWVVHKWLDPSRRSFRCLSAHGSLRWGSHSWQQQFIALWQLWLSESSQFCSCQPGILVFSSEAPWDCVFSLFPHISHDDKSCFLPECHWETGSIITEPGLTTLCILGCCPLCFTWSLSPFPALRSVFPVWVRQQRVWFHFSCYCSLSFHLHTHVLALIGNWAPNPLKLWNIFNINCFTTGFLLPCVEWDFVLILTH